MCNNRDKRPEDKTICPGDWVEGKITDHICGRRRTHTSLAATTQFHGGVWNSYGGIGFRQDVAGQPTAWDSFVLRHPAHLTRGGLPAQDEQENQSHEFGQ